MQTLMLGETIVGQSHQDGEKLECNLFSGGILLTETNLKKIVTNMNINLSEKSLKGSAVEATYDEAIT